jgi:predicted ribosome-associated RNA-binding protein Tma20
MKRPLTTTVCRVNLIRATRQQVLDELTTFIQKTVPQLEVCEHPIFSDVLTIMPHHSSNNHNHNHNNNNDDDDDDDDDDSENYSQTSSSSNNNNNQRMSLQPALSNCTVPKKDDGVSALFTDWPKRKKRGWPMTHRAILCDRFCAEAVLRGSDVFVKGVMAADWGIQAGETVAVYADIPRTPTATTTTTTTNKTLSIPRGLLLEKYQGHCVFLGLGKAACSRNEIFKSNQGLAVSMSLDPKDRAVPLMPPLHGVLADKMMLQNLPSIVVAHCLNPMPNDVILDMCSAPGGKASHLASLVNNRATIIACDRSRKKMVTAKALFDRMGASCITPLALDSTKCLNEAVNQHGQSIEHVRIAVRRIQYCARISHVSYTTVLLTTDVLVFLIPLRLLDDPRRCS